MLPLYDRKCEQGYNNAEENAADQAVVLSKSLAAQNSAKCSAKRSD